MVILRRFIFWSFLLSFRLSKLSRRCKKGIAQTQNRTEVSRSYRRVVSANLDGGRSPTGRSLLQYPGWINSWHTTTALPELQWSEWLLFQHLGGICKLFHSLFGESYNRQEQKRNPARTQNRTEVSRIRSLANDDEGCR